MRYCGHFLIKAEGGAKNYKRDHPLPLAWRSFTVAFVQRKGYTGSMLLQILEEETRLTHDGHQALPPRSGWVKGLASETMTLASDLLERGTTNLNGNL